MDPASERTSKWSPATSALSPLKCAHSQCLNREFSTLAPLDTQVSGFMPFPYHQRAAIVREKQAALHAAFADVRHRYDRSPANQRWRRSIEELRAALEAAFPPDFDAALNGLRRADCGGIDVLIEFLEADPMFFRSGYVKTQILRALKRVPLTLPQVSRLHAVILGVVGTRWNREFGDYVRLALKLDDPNLRAGLRELVSAPGADTRRRAKRMLATLPATPGGPPRDWRRQGG